MEGRNDRRQFGALRIPAQLRAEVVHADLIPTQTIDVSQNGVLIQGPIPKDLDDFIRLRLYLPPQQAPIEALGRVARKFQRADREAFGIQFIEMTSEHQTAWLEYISRIESLTLAQGSLTSTSHLLQGRKATGRGAQGLIFRFKTPEGLRDFAADFTGEAGFFIPVPIMKSIGEKIELTLVKADSDEAFEVEGEVLPPQGQFPSAERMGLKVRLSADAARAAAFKKFAS